MQGDLCRRAATLVTFLVTVLAIGATTGHAQITSTWLTNVNSGSWFTASNWDNGIPNAAGDTARFPANLSRSIQLTQQATVGQLDLFGLDQVNITGTGLLVFDRPGSDPALLQTVPASGVGVAGLISNPISIAANEQLSIVVGQLTSLALNGAISASSGDITKSGKGLLSLGAGSAGWAGRLFITGGTVDALNAAGLGTTAGNTVVSNGAFLILRTSSSEPLEFDAGTVTTNATSAVTMTSPISLTGSGTIRNLSASQGATWSGVISGAGSLALQNSSSTATVISGTNTYTGRTFVTEGNIRATNTNSFGSASEGTTIQGGTATVEALTDEEFLVTGGTLSFTAAAANYSHTVSLNGGTLNLPTVVGLPTPVVVGSAGGSVQLNSVGTTWAGGASGTGNLQINGQGIVTGPLNHQGSLTVASIKLNAASGYQGETIVTGGAELNHVNGLGSSPKVRIRNFGSMKLNVMPSNNPEYVVESGTLTFVNPAQPISTSITLGGATSGTTGEAILAGPAIYNGPIYLVPDGVFRQRISSGTVNGGISGRGNLQLNSVDLNSANDIYGWIEVTAGTVNVNHADALNGAMTSVSNGRLNLNVPTTGNVITNEGSSATGTVAFNAAQNYADPWVVNAGTIEASATVGMSKLIVLAATVRGIGGGSFRLDGDMNVVRSGAIEGGISGNGDVHLNGYQLSLGQNLTNFTGDFHVHTGTMNIGYLASGSTSPTTLNPETEIHVYDGGTVGWANGTSSDDVIITNDIFLHNSHGSFGHSGALVRQGNGSHTLRGRVDVGDQGSTIAGSFRIEGPLTGNNLTLAYGGITLSNTQNQLHGTLRLREEAALALTEQARLIGVDSIRLEQGSTLTLGASTLTDRLDDTTDVVSSGGFISLYSSNNAVINETFGKVKLEQGFTRLFVSSDHGSMAAGLTINELVRNPGSILKFGQAGFQNSTKVNGLNLQHGIIGPWAITDTGFATVGSNGLITTKSATSFTDINAAGAQDHARISGNQTLAADKVVASLQYEPNGNPAALNLNGHQLTVLSGGIFRSQEIKNGRLTAGTSGAAELVIHQGREPISADIVDNAAGGAVALVLTGGYTQLSGNNSYTGGTRIVGSGDLTSSFSDHQVFIKNLSAVPANDRVFVDCGVYDTQSITAGTINLAELHLRGGGKIRGHTGAPLNVAQMFLEDGQVVTRLTGNGSIVKETDGVVDFAGQTSPAFTGTFTIRDGIVTAPSNTLPQAQFILEGGELNLQGGSFAKDIVLRGGTLHSGRFSGRVDVQADSSLLSDGATTITGQLTGSGDLLVRGRQDNSFTYYFGLFGDASTYSGNITIESAALRVGAPGSAGTGTISVMQAGRFIIGSSSSSNPNTTLSNEIHLYGGTLYGYPPGTSSDASPNILTGGVFVHNEAFIGALQNGFKSGQRLPGLRFAGQLTLTDGSDVYGLSDGRSTIANGDVALVDISGELRVGANTTWHLLTSSLSISGLIRPTGPNSSINFEGIPTLLRMAGAGIQVDAGQSLSISLNGQAADVQLSGSGNTIQGSGLLQGDYTVANGAAVSPGNSPGLLTIDGDTTFAAGGHLSIELAGTIRGMQYDALDVSGDVLIDGGLLDVSLLGGFVPTSDDGFILLRGRHVNGKFANALSSIVVGGQSLPVTYFDQMVVLGNAAAVPEPGTLLLVVVGMCFGGHLFRSRRCRMH